MSRVTERFRHEARVVFTTPPGLNAFNLTAMVVWLWCAWVMSPGFLVGFVSSSIFFAWGQHQQKKLLTLRAETAVLIAQTDARVKAMQEVLRQMTEEDF